MGAGLWNRGNVLVGLYGMWQDAEKKPKDGRYWNKGVAVDLGLIVSNNGIHFREPVPDHKVIARGAEGEWEASTSGFLFEPHGNWKLDGLDQRLGRADHDDLFLLLVDIFLLLGGLFFFISSAFLMSSAIWISSAVFLICSAFSLAALPLAAFSLAAITS